jgi:UDP-2,3-diacylglucosamine pyrophosphatase LpxH
MESILADTLIISDLHLGSEVSRARDACQMLSAAMFRRLILLGDIFCDLNFGRLKKQHWHFLSMIRKLSSPKRDVEVVWVEGNHDRGLSDVMSHLVGVPVFQEYEWTFAGRRFIAIHGHQFDRFLVRNAVLSRLGEWTFLHMQRIDSKRKVLSRFLDRQNSRWLRLSPKVAAGAIALAKHRRADVVFCGHTHEPCCIEKDGISYYNSGCWTTSRLPTFISISEAGVNIHEFVSDNTPDIRSDFQVTFSGSAPNDGEGESEQLHFRSAVAIDSRTSFSRF